MKNFISEYSEELSNKYYNEDLILKIRKEDDIMSYLRDVCKAIENIAPKYIKFKNFYYEDNIKKSRELNKNTKVEGELPKQVVINLEPTYARLAIFEFECTLEIDVLDANDRPTGERKVVVETKSFSIWVPKLIDNCHFLVKGNKYSAPLQIVDAITFSNKKNIIVLKMMTRAQKLEKTTFRMEDIYGQQYYTNIMLIANKTSNRFSFLLYYFAHFGFFKTIKFFGMENIIDVYTDDPSDTSIPKNKIIFKFGTTYLVVDKLYFENKYIVPQFVGCILSLVKKKKSLTIDNIKDCGFWVSMLGERITSLPARFMDSGINLLNTFITMMDYRTITIINQLVTEGNRKCDIFSVMRWVFIKFNQLANKDNGLQNKRIRFSEYIVSPFIKEFTDRVYKFINLKDKDKNLRKLNDIMLIPSSILIDAISAKMSIQTTGMNIIRYDNATNDNDLAGPLLEYSFAGPGSPMGKAGKHSSGANNRFTSDFIGKICIITAANSDPGISGCLTSNCDIDYDKKIFNVDQELTKI